MIRQLKNEQHEKNLELEDLIKEVNLAKEEKETIGNKM